MVRDISLLHMMPGVEGIYKLGERATSDLIARLRTDDGRDDWYYCHSSIVSGKSKYFTTHLSDEPPTCQLMDSRKCIEIHCKESDIDYHVTLLRLLYVSNEAIISMLFSVKNALGVLKVAKKLGCDNVVSKCVEYLEAMPWEENEEEDILKTLPSLGTDAVPILARLQPVELEAVSKIFLSAVRVATIPRILPDIGTFSCDFKALAQEQVEYMLSEDDDAPLLVADEKVKMEVKQQILDLLKSFKEQMVIVLSEAVVGVEPVEDDVLEKVSDLLWASEILSSLFPPSELVIFWEEATDGTLEILQNKKLNASLWKTKLKVIELTKKVLEAVAYGSVILSTPKRTHLVKSWLPYIRETKPLLDLQFFHKKIDNSMDEDLCQSIESAFVSIVLSLPSGDQAEILTDWLQTIQAQFPDLSEAFEVWCYWMKTAKRRLGNLNELVVNSSGGLEDEGSYFSKLYNSQKRLKVMS